MPWGNEKHMRPIIEARRIKCASLRALGWTWRQIAGELGYGSPQHARIDWLRWCDSLTHPAR